MGAFGVVYSADLPLLQEKVRERRYAYVKIYVDIERANAFSYNFSYCSHGFQVAVKMMDLPKTIFDRCVLHDIFTEITILDQFSGDSRVCKMNDYGVDDGHYWITMKYYKCRCASIFILRHQCTVL